MNLHKSSANRDELNFIIDCIPNVVNLDLSSTSCSDKTLAYMQEMCPKLQSLDVRNCEYVTGEGMKYLCGENLSLTRLNILYTNVVISGVVAVLDGMPSLECIKHAELAHLFYELDDKTGPYNLTEFVYGEFESEKYNSFKIMQVLGEKCPKLKKIHFNHAVQEKTLRCCTRFQYLEELKFKMLYSVKSDDFLQPILPVSKKLKTLILSSLEISVVTLVKYFTNLENLHLKNVNFKEFKEEDIECSETKLRMLAIRDDDDDDYMDVSSSRYKALAFLFSLSKNVTELYLSEMPVLPPRIFEIIANSMKNLAVVKFKSCVVRMSYLVPLFDIPSMKMLFANNRMVDNSKLKLAKKLSCTLSWRDLTFDSDEEEEIDEGHYDYDEDICESDLHSSDES